MRFPDSYLVEAEDTLEDEERKFQSMDLWAYCNEVKIDFSRPGKPADNAFVESFNGTSRSECLNILSRAE